MVATAPGARFPVHVRLGLANDTRKHNFRLPRNNRALAAVVLAGPLVALLSPLLSATASATTAGPADAAAHAPELSIGVSDGRRHVQPGDLLTYAVKIHNIGKRDVPRLRIVQTLPVNMKLISATRHPARHAGQLTWQLNLPAQRTYTFHVVGRVGQTPRQLLRLATIACANIGARRSSCRGVCPTRPTTWKVYVRWAGR